MGGLGASTQRRVLDRKKLTGRECVTELIKCVRVNDEIFADVEAIECPEFPLTDLENMEEERMAVLRAGQHS
ncbi:hypothetical protein L596_011833 [Steinernema carpocapsae]|uniref:Uncharacterized protein n=1 Tax=Steinernema carpocapsae TaxID=34508 RepID=A0A4V6A4P1_STECR|nr:hypothetical protein L596_011833 [Steinernema carpocapsae]